jgi:hypothetical protein
LNKLDWNELGKKLEEQGITPEQAEKMIKAYRLIRATVKELDDWVKEEEKKPTQSE